MLSIFVHLRQIKLAGFKSFADPALIELNRPLVGIVGPNGCGKSNIIDAVRWVLGEARVSELRGSASMSELIFAGSTSRASMGRASVELVLDNVEGRVKGPWGQYAELSVKRVVTRDGQSQYFLNHQLVRRRDVQDIFLGTGLGPRSYAIISQGMIASFIKAKPEELRVYLEEAAGISLYKERRRETETLLNQTRANLERVADLQHIKAQEIERLGEEAKVAAAYAELDRRRRASESLWYFMQYTEAQQECAHLESKVSELESTISQKKTQQALMETERPSLVENEQLAQSALNAAQAALRTAERRLLETQGERKRLIERREQAQLDLQSAQLTIEAKSAQKAKASAECELALAGSGDKAQEAQVLEEELAVFEEQLFALTDAQEEALQIFDETQERVQGAKTALEVLKQSAVLVTKTLTSVRAQQNKVSQEHSQLAVPDTAAISSLEEMCEALDEEVLALQEDISIAESDRETAAIKAQDLRDDYYRALAEEKEVAAKLEALEDIQAKSADNERAAQWFETQGLSGLPRAFEDLDVDSRWLVALESVLAEKTQAFGIRQMGLLEGFAVSRPPVRLAFYESLKISARQNEFVNDWDTLGFAALSSFVNTKSEALGYALNDWLNGIYVVDNLTAALKCRQKLPQGMTLVTPQGDRITSTSVVFWTADDPSLEVLSRSREIHALADRQSALEEVLTRKERDRIEAEVSLSALKEQVASARQLLLQRQEEREKARLSLSRLKSEQLAYEEHQTRLSLSAQEVAARLEDLTMEAEAKEEAIFHQEALLEDWLLKLEDARQKKQRTTTDLQSAERRQSDTRHRQAMLQLQAQEAARRVRALKESIEAFERDLIREKEREADAKARLEMCDDRVLSEGLTRLIDEHSQAQQHAAKTTDDLSVATLALAQNDSKVRELAAAILPMTEMLGGLRVKRQLAVSLKAQFEERLTELNADREVLAQEAQKRPVKASTLKADISKLIAEMAALGPVNHAALEHLKRAQEEMRVTEEQVLDLSEAITTLENAIRKIDSETRQRLRETFTAVNANFAEMFTGLFGGGAATLSMSGEDVLDAGVEVHAQPPGKRNASVKLLSGGEQALTATALVFAIFKLNPAPFCLLDEVDAPLDEANQARLAGLCAKMSAATQFLIITHHRVTMEYAQALIGVTMKEPGVSRIVSVDIEEAARMTS